MAVKLPNVLDLGLVNKTKIKPIENELVDRSVNKSIDVVEEDKVEIPSFLEYRPVEAECFRDVPRRTKKIVVKKTKKKANSKPSLKGLIKNLFN